MKAQTIVKKVIILTSVNVYSDNTNVSFYSLEAIIYYAGINKNY